MGHIDNKLILASIIILFFLGHLVYANTPFVNLEWIYKIGSNFFLTGDKAYLDFYLSEQANPITYSFFSSFVVLIFGDNYISYRLLALLGGCLILLGVAKYRSPFLLLIIGLNPLIWIYSGRAYSELLAAGLLVLAIELNTSKSFLKGTLGALAATIKFHTILFSASYWGLKWIDKLWNLKKLNLNDSDLKNAIYSTGLFFIFLVAYFYIYDVWIIPEKYKTTLDINASNFINNFFSYGFYLSALFFITIPHFLSNSRLKSHLVALLVSVPLALINQDTGEMNFGSLDQILGTEVILIVKVLGFWNFLLCLEFFLKDQGTRPIVLAIFAYMILISLTRPAQRYLIFVIPFWAILIVQSKLEIKLFFKVLYTCLLLASIIFTSIYQVQNSIASEKISQWSKANQRLINTNVIYPHIGDSPYHSWDSNIIVKTYVKEEQEILFLSDVRILGYSIRKYYVVED